MFRVWRQFLKPGGRLVLDFDHPRFPPLAYTIQRADGSIYSRWSVENRRFVQQAREQCRQFYASMQLTLHPSSPAIDVLLGALPTRASPSRFLRYCAISFPRFMPGGSTSGGS
jgi:hypothetical protein